MQAYLDLLRRVYETGIDKSDRTGTGTRSLFGAQCRYDLAQTFPLVTTKKVFLKGVIYELLWLLKGETNIKFLVDHDVHIWDGWATESGELGPVYGAQWRSWPTADGGTIDQITALVDELQTNPDSRRLIVSAWNPAVLPDVKMSPKENAANGRQALPPCHTLFQFYVVKGKLSCQLYQRSGDLFLGVPFNIASYSLLTLMLAQVTNLKPGEFIHTLGDAHIYQNHFAQVEEQLARAPRPLPTMRLNSAVKNIFDFKYEDFELTGYDPWPTIKAPVAI